MADVNVVMNDDKQLCAQMNKLTKADLINQLNMLGMETNENKQELISRLVSANKVKIVQHNLNTVEDPKDVEIHYLKEIVEQLKSKICLQ